MEDGRGGVENMKEISQQEVIKHLSYNSSTGEFTWKACYSGRKKRGKSAGSVKKRGNIEYLEICINNQKFAAHRLAWLYVHGNMPIGVIDHIDGNGLNNRITNLRDVTHKENTRNASLSRRNQSGCIGVYQDSSSQRWRAEICFNNRKIKLGSFDNIFEAACARKSAQNTFKFHRNHGRKSVS